MAIRSSHRRFTLHERRFTLLVVTGDPGGARVLIPGITVLRKKHPGWKFKVLAGPNSRPLWKAAGFGARSWPSVRLSRVVCRKILLKAKPDILITGTSFENPTESWFRLEANRERIASFSALDHWCNYRQRYEIGRRLILPDVIGVMDRLAAAKMVQAGIPRRKLAVIGHPVLEPFLKRKKPAARDRRQVLYLSEPISWDGRLSPRVVRYPKHNELTLLKGLLAVFTANPRLVRYGLRIRPHPLEPLSRLKKILRQHSPRGLRVTLDRKRPLEKDLDASRVVLGITSIALLQARLAGRPVLSLQPDHARGRIPDDILCFLPRVRSNGCSIEAVAQFVSARKTNGKRFIAGRRPLLPRNSSVRIAREIEKLVGGR